MSFFDDASLVMIPSGYKDQKVYSVKPIDGSGDLTFSRGSDIEATRVAANGFIQKAAVNLLLQSNSFDTTWVNNNTTDTSGQSGYDGSSDAWLIETTNVASSECRMRQDSITTTSGVHSVSVYMKADSLSIGYLQIVEGSNNIYWFCNLTNGNTNYVATGNHIDITSQEIGGGWYRLTGTWLCGGSSLSVRIGVSNSMTSPYITSSGGEGIYIQDAQVNYGLVAQEYQETTTTSVVSGITNDMPRLDYSGGASCPSLLLEPSRQNLVESTEFFGASNWILSGSAITTNATTSPEGVANATKLEGDGSSVNVRLYDNYSYPSTGDYTFSVYAKAGTNDFVLISILGVDGGKARYFDLVNGIAGSVDSKIEAIGTDGWYRCSFTATLTGPDITGNFNIYVPYSIDTTSFPSAGDANGQYVYIYGAQLEAGSYPTSYIPNYGLTSGATRLDDDMDTTFASPFATDGSATIFFHDLGVADSDGIISTAGRYRYQKDGDNYVSLTTNDTAWRVRIQGGGNGHFEGLNDHPKTSPIKVAVIVSSTHYSIFANGVKEIDNVALSATADFSSINDFLTFMQEDTGARRAVQHLIFPTALTDAEAIALTA